MTTNYQPAEWPGDSKWSRLTDHNMYETEDLPSEFFNRYGRRCRLVCDPLPTENLRRIARMIMGRTIQQALLIYPNIRVVVKDGRPLPITQDYRSNRINVEVFRNVIARIIGFY